MLILYILYCGITLDFCKILKMNNLEKKKMFVWEHGIRGFRPWSGNPVSFCPVLKQTIIVWASVREHIRELLTPLNTHFLPVRPTAKTSGPE